MHVMTIAALVAVAYGWWRGRAAVAGTTLLSAWRWGVAAIVLSLAAAVVEPLGTTFRSVADHLWYASCVLWVCPAVAVLGARRPGSGAWGGFVMIPLVLVLEWPVTGVAVAGRVSGVSSGPLLQNVHLDWPELVAWLVVLVLGTGNYVLTRRGAVVLAGVGGIVAFLWPLTGSIPAGTWVEFTRLGGALLLSGAVWRARRSSTVFPSEPDPDLGERLARAWDDFYQAYGLVWAARVGARVNEELARIEGGGVLGPGGVAFADEDTVAAEQRVVVYQRTESTLRWLWGRFVDDAWIESRLGPGAPLGAKEPRGL